MKLAILVAVGAAIISGPSTKAEAGNGCMVTATVEPTHTTVFSGASIELAVGFQNSRSADDKAWIAVAYPSLGAHGYPGLTLSYKDETVGTVTANLPPNQIESVIPVSGDSKWTAKVYLQRYAPSPGNGVRKVFWTLKLPCVTSDGRDLGLLEQHGTFTVDVKTASAQELAKIAQAYSAAVDSEISKDRQEAVEALVVFPDPIVIPELQKLLKAGYTSQAFEGLSKFSGNDLAMNIVLEAMRSGDRPQVMGALQTFIKWKVPPPAEAVQTLVDSDSPTLQIEFLRYVEQVRNREYLPAVSRLTASSDESVSQFAKQVESHLKTHAK